MSFENKKIPEVKSEAEEIAERKASISAASDFRDLIANVLPYVGDIKGSDDYVYTVKNLQEIINGVRVKPELINTVTRTYGLREKVSQLLEKNSK